MHDPGPGAASPDGIRGGLRPKEFEGQTLNVYNWGEYVDMSVIRAFEKEYGVRVNYKTFESNEYLWLQMQSGDSWDVIVPSDYMIERLIKEKMVQPIDKSIVTNLDCLTEGAKNLDCDPDNTYCRPTSGRRGHPLRHHEDLHREDGGQGWDTFHDPDYAGHCLYVRLRAGRLHDGRQGPGILREHGEPGGDPGGLRVAAGHAQGGAARLRDGRGHRRHGQRAKWMAPVYSGDAAYILSENENMAFCAPKQGTNIAVDAMVIPANANNPKLANVFIQYIMTEEVSEAISVEVGYASPNAAVLERLSGPGGEYEGNAAYLPRAGYELDEAYADLPEDWQSREPDLWIRVMAE